MRDRRYHHDGAGQPGEPDPVHQGGGQNGGTGYPQARLLALAACGTRTLIDAVCGPATSGETTCAADLLRSLRAGMLMLADRNFAAGWLFAAIAATKADVLVRVKTGRGAPRLPVSRRQAAGVRHCAAPRSALPSLRQATVPRSPGWRSSACRSATRSGS